MIGGSRPQTSASAALNYRLQMRQMREKSDEQKSASTSLGFTLPNGNRSDPFSDPYSNGNNPAT